MIVRKLVQQLNGSIKIRSFNSHMRDHLLKAKQQNNLTFEQIAKHLERNEVWTAALFHNQQTASESEANKLIELLKISDNQINEIKSYLTTVPVRGGSDHLHDPAVYRMYELISVYGPTLKSIINEKFGDGIMSSVDCSLSVRKHIKPDGEQRVVIQIDGKYLPYKSE